MLFAVMYIVHAPALISACDTRIKFCDFCNKNAKDEILCTECSHPNGYPLVLTKNQKKCKSKSSWHNSV